MKASLTPGEGTLVTPRSSARPPEYWRFHSNDRDALAVVSDVDIGCGIRGTGDDSDHSGGNGGDGDHSGGNGGNGDHSGGNNGVDGDQINLDLAKKQEHQPEGGDGERDYNCG